MPFVGISMDAVRDQSRLRHLCAPEPVLPEHADAQGGPLDLRSRQGRRGGCHLSPLNLAKPAGHLGNPTIGRSWRGSRATLLELQMPDLFSPYTLKGVTLRNRIVMSPMTMYRSRDGLMNDFHVMLLGSRAAGGFGLVFPEQLAITAQGRTSVSCGGIYDDAQIEGLKRVTSIIKDMGAVPAIQLGHTGRKGSELKPWEGGAQLPPDHPDGWQVVGPSAIPYGAKSPYPVHALSIDEIKEIHRAYARAAKRAVVAGFEWLELHFAHGYLGASFFSPLANARTDQYGGSLENRLRFHLEALDAVRAVWPERFPLSMRLGSDDLHAEGVQFEDAMTAVRVMKDHGLDLADLSLGLNTPHLQTRPFNEPGFMVERAARGARARNRHPRGCQLEPRPAGHGRPDDPRRDDRPGAAGPPGAVQPALACLGRPGARSPGALLSGAGRLGVVAAQLPRP
jgi:2,4-dienoyl-CoA reductase-like NADH-dependent reductase (Old Yellow Enzyme family)